MALLGKTIETPKSIVEGGVVDSIRGSNALVVGGAGFIGSNLVRYLLELGVERVTVVDNLLSSESANVPMDARVDFVFGSITSPEILASLPNDLDYAFHLSCFHGNQSSIADPLMDHENNTLTSLKLFERLKEIRSLRKVVYAAAACAVAEKTYHDPSPTTEDQPISLFHDSPYSISKLIGELYGNYYYQRFQMPFVKARFSNCYGAGEILGAGRWRGTVHTVWRNVVPTFVWKSLQGEALPLDNGGNASRDFIHVSDMVRGLVACALRGKAGEAYNLATGKETTILTLANAINQATGNKTPVELRPARDWDRSGKRFASTEKSENDLGFRASMDIERGIADTVGWTKANAELIRSCIVRHEKLMAQAGG